VFKFLVVGQFDENNLGGRDRVPPSPQNFCDWGLTSFDPNHPEKSNWPPKFFEKSLAKQ
jgi:hypothetical protein